MIVFPSIDLLNGRCVQLRQGDPASEIVHDDDPVRAARRWVEQCAEWLHVVNLDGAFASQRPTNERVSEDAESLPLNLQRLRDIRAAVDVPIQFAGGLRSMEALIRAVDLGADRLVIGTAAIENPVLVEQALDSWGPDRIVVAIEARDGLVVTHGWQTRREIRPEELGCRVRVQGVRHALYTNVDREGMLGGVDLEGTLRLAAATGLRIIVSGGVAGIEDVRLLAEVANDVVEGVIVGQALYTGRLDLGEALRAARRASSEGRRDSAVTAAGDRGDQPSARIETI